MAIKIGKLPIQDIINNVANSKEFLRRVRESLNIIRPELSEKFVEAYDRTLLHQALIGDFSGNKEFDLPAHLGFGRDPAPSAIDVDSQIRFGLSEVLQVTPIRRSYGKFSFNITVVGFQEILQSQLDGSYITEKGDIINWLEWLLEGIGDIDGYSIRFDYELKNVNIGSISRSGRAIMVKDGGGWSVGDYTFAENENFIIDILNDLTWQEDAQNIVETVFGNVLRNG